jgi:methylglutaconyl-CoA hydratase
VLGLPETSLAIVPGAGGTQRLTRLIGRARSLELILRAARIDAAESLSLGLVNRVTPPGADVVEDTLAWIEPILHGAPIALEGALAAVRAADAVPLTEGLELERAAYEACLASADRLEALQAFRDKRKPLFKGK